MKYLTSLLILLFLFLPSSYAQDLNIELFASNLDLPVAIKHAGDDKLYVAERQGFISIINADGSVNPIPFLDIDTNVIDNSTIQDERGLLGLAFHPDYNTNGYFYVNYIDNDGDTVISRYTRNTTNPLIADSSSELIILSYDQPYSNHNGGDLAFDSNGYLFIASGDGGNANDPQNFSQNTNNLLGSILRIDINSTTTTQNYTIPSDNPFISDPTARDEIWAYGLRNPWKFSFDRLNGDLWIGDVGQEDYEEINKVSATSAGLNYGWRCYEANAAFNTTNCPDPSTLTFPIADYSHFNDGVFRCSVIGGYRYRGTNFSGFEGWYFFADYCGQEIGYLVYDDVNDLWNMTLEQFSGIWTAFGEDVNGEVYVADILSGNIYQLVDDNALNINDNKYSNITIYPNPSKNEITINFGSIKNFTDSTKITIYDLQGEIIKTINKDADIVQKVNTSEFSKGIYILKIQTKNSTLSTHKLVIN